MLASPCLRRPGAPCEALPGEVHARNGHAFEERRQRRHPSVRDGRQPEVGQVEKRRPEAGRDEHVVGLERQLARPRRPARRDPEGVAAPLDPLDGRVDDERAGPAAGVLVERVQVPGADGQASDARGVHRARGREDELRGPREEPGRDLEARVALADDEDPAAAVVLGRARVHVVPRVLDARDRRLPGLGDADREHRGAAAVLAVGGLQHEPVLLAARRLPAAPVADLEPGPLGERGEAGLHLLPRRHVVRPVHQLWHEGARLGLVGEQAVVVVPLVLARAPARTARPASSR